MSKNYDLIATVDIDIASPIIDDTSFDNLLIVGPLPKVIPARTPPKTGVYASLDEVTAAGWSAVGEDADPVGLAAQAAFAQSPSPNAIYIAPIQLESTAAETGESAEGTEPAEKAVPEKAVLAVQRALGMTGWYVVCTAGVDPCEYEEIAAYIETQEKMFCYTETDFFAKNSVPSVGNVYYRTFGIYGCQNSEQSRDDMPRANPYINAAWTAKWLNYASGSETSAFKALASVYPSELTSTEMKLLSEAKINYFVTVGNKNITLGGYTMAGEWADVIRFRDWLKNDMQVRVVNLFITRPKVPYTDSGISLVQNQMIAALKAGQDAGGIAEDEFDEDGNRIPGYATSVPLASSLTDSERASRRLTKCRFKARLAGAIHFAEITGSLTYSL